MEYLKSDSRKRTLPSLLFHNEKRERRASQSSEASASSVSDEKLKCRLCDSRRGFKNAEDFDFHLTMIHYRDKLIDLIGDPPYMCAFCRFQPTAEDPTEEMILHMGCRERAAIKFYVKDCNLEDQNKKPRKEPTFPRDTVTCKLCNQLNTTQQLFLVHITQKHYAEDIRKKIPQDSPFKCPYKGCSQIFPDRQALLMHYGIDHKYSLSLYDPPKGEAKGKIMEFDMFKPKTMLTCTMCREKKFLTASSLKHHEILAHFFPDVMKDTGLARCPNCRLKFNSRTEFAKHFIEDHYDEYVKTRSDAKTPDGKKAEPVLAKVKKDNKSDVRSKEATALSNQSLNRSLEEELPSPTTSGKVREMKTVHRSTHVREMKTVHKSNVREITTVHHSKSDFGSASSARQRMMNKWKSTSIDAQKFEIDKLTDEIRVLKEEHKEAIRAKATEFERWIGQKEDAIQEEIDKRTKVESALERANVEIAELKKLAEQKENKINQLEEVVIEEHNR